MYLSSSGAEAGGAQRSSLLLNPGLQGVQDSVLPAQVVQAVQPALLSSHPTSGTPKDASALCQYCVPMLQGLNALDLELYKFTLLLSMLDAIVFDVAAAAGIDTSSDSKSMPQV